MRFALTGEQRELASAVREMLAKECPPEVARAGDVASVWPTFAGLGVLGDSDFGLVEAVIVAEEAGRAGLPGPLPETYAALAIADADWRSRIASGAALVTAAAPYAAYADAADGIAVGNALRTDLVTTSVESVDPARPLSAVDAERVTGRAHDIGALVTSAYLVGLGRAMVEQAVAYARAREQFGRVIGSFQAVKHRLADAHIAVEFARPVALAAAWGMDNDVASTERDVSHAKLRAGRAAHVAAKAALQVHGAIGYTEECDLVIWLRRTWSMTSSFGDDSTHRARIARDIARAPERV
ncbi:MAG: acyl-CoA dehydrogenase family protein [Actinomycetes bacterium]